MKKGILLGIVALAEILPCQADNQGAAAPSGIELYILRESGL